MRKFILIGLGLAAIVAGSVRAQDSGDATLSADEFVKRFNDIGREDAGQLANLGERAAAAGLDSYAKRAFRAALRVDPDHEIARKKLGFVRFAGEWTTVDAVKADRGLDYVDGAWVVPGNAPKAKVVKPAPAVEKKPEPKKVEPKKVEEVKSWFDDHETIGPWAEAPITKSKRYRIRSNIKPEYVKRYGQLLDRYAERLKPVFQPLIPPNMKIRLKPSLITIYPDEDTFLKTEKRPKGVGGYYRLDNQIVVCFHGRFGKTGTTQNVLGHECTHQFQHLVTGDSFLNCPIWLVEGLATIFESAEWNVKKNTVDIGKIAVDRMTTMKRAVKDGKVIPLSTLFRTQQQGFSGYHYAHAWSFLYMCIFGAKGKKARSANSKLFSSIVEKARSHKVRYREVLAIFGGEAALSQLEERWKKWIAETEMDFTP